MKLNFWEHPIGTVLTVFAISLLVLVWVWWGSFGACVTGSMDDSLQKTIAALDGIVDLGLKFSTSLVGFGAALLIGLKGGITLTSSIRTSVLLSMLMFTWSALYAVVWRFGVANMWLNKCLNLVIEQTMQRRYEAHLFFFMLGLISLFSLVLVAAQSRSKTG